MTFINDEDFPNPSEINLHPCLSSARYLHTVPESVQITQICQDSSNPSLVIINFTLVGAFLFTPSLNILEVDGDDSYTLNNIKGIFALGHYKNPNIPIDTQCSTYQGQIVFDIGQKILNYTSSQIIKLELVMAGQVPLSYGVSYPNQIVSSIYDWYKGVLPRPNNITYNNGFLGITFDYGSAGCSCELQCVTPTGVSQKITFCPDDTQTIVLERDPNSLDPYSILVELSDPLGNISKLALQTLYNTKPKSLFLTTSTTPKKIELTLDRTSVNNISITSEAYYRIYKYSGSKNNVSIWKDWSNIDWNHFIDYDIIVGETYGYAVVFKGQFNDISLQSDWSETIL